MLLFDYGQPCVHGGEDVAVTFVLAADGGAQVLDQLAEFCEVRVATARSHLVVSHHDEMAPRIDLVFRYHVR